MKDNSRNEALLEILRQGLEFTDFTNTKQNLGNRAAYLGLSDLAKYQECPRAALAAKLLPRSNSLGCLLTMQRGHWFENGLAACFKNLDLKFLSQLEIAINYHGAPIKAHLDLTLVWDKPYPAIRVVEVKSVGKLPEQPYAAHIWQSQGQIDLLARFWAEPVFSLRDNAGALLAEKMNFPETVKKCLGICMPAEPDKISLESWLVYLSMKDASCFGPFGPDEASLIALLENGRKMWLQYIEAARDATALAKAPYAHGYYPLCSYCEYSADCPKFASGREAKDWNEAILSLQALKAQKSNLDDKIKAIENELKRVGEHTGTNDWLETGDYRFRTTTVAGRRSLDRELLQANLDELFQTLGLTEISCASIIEKSERQAAPSARLQILPMK